MMKKRLSWLVLCVLLTAALCLSSLGSTAQPIPRAPIYPVASGVHTVDNSQALIDYSNTADGYILASYRGDATMRAKLRLSCGERSYTYDLDSAGTLTSFPLNMGNGTYTVTMYQQVSGTSYRAIATTSFDVSLSSEFAPYLASTQLINFTADSATVAKAAELVTAAAATTDLQKLQAIYSYIVSTMSYDYHRAATVQSGYIPTPDIALAEQGGICFDYSSLMAAMLRSQGVPSRLITGYVSQDNLYHAWIEVYIENTGWVATGISIGASGYKMLDPTFATTMSADSVAKYIGSNPSNYTVRYAY